jgi:hypothetical protein
MTFGNIDHLRSFVSSPSLSAGNCVVEKRRSTRLSAGFFIRSTNILFTLNNFSPGVAPLQGYAKLSVDPQQ